MNTKAENGTALTSAAGQGHTETVKALIELGVDVNADDGSGLMAAALEGRTETVKALIEAGADVNAKDMNGDTALTWAAGPGHTEIVEILRQAGARR